MSLWNSRKRSSQVRATRARARKVPVRAAFEALEPRILFAGDLPSVTLIEADNRGGIVISVNRDLREDSINQNSVRVTTAGADSLFGTADDVLVQRTVSYDVERRQIRITANIPADRRYSVTLDSSMIRQRGTDVRLDGEFTGASTISGDGIEGGDLVFYTRPAAQAVVRFTTVRGNIDVDLFTDRTPLTVRNFQTYMNRGVWDSTFFHRSVANFVIQGGGFTSTSSFPNIPADPPVQNEPGISNVRGTIAMAKLGNDPNSATNQWFFSLADNSSNLDNQNGGFTVFGRVRNDASLAVMDALGTLPRFNASSQNGAFNEIPVLDLPSVQARGSIVPEDLARVTRIAQFVDLSGEPASQLDPMGSMIIAPTPGQGGAGSTARVQIYDLDRTGAVGDGSYVRVNFGRGNAISSIQLMGTAPAGRVGIVITGADSIGMIQDLRTDTSGGLAFIVSSASVGSIYLKSSLDGYNLNDVVLPGLVLDADIDGDGDLLDETALYFPTGFVTSLNLPAGIGGDVVLPGGLFSANVGGLVDQADFQIGPSDRFMNLNFNRVTDSELRTTAPINSLRAVEWLDKVGRQDVIEARLINTLTITGDRRQGIDGNFNAGLTLTPTDINILSLRSLQVAGGVFDAVWTLLGDSGNLLVRGDAYGLSIDGARNIASIRFGAVYNSSIDAIGFIPTITAVTWEGGAINAERIGSIMFLGDARRGIAGNLMADLTVGSGPSQAANRPTIRSMTVAGSILRSTMLIRGNFDTLTAMGTVSNLNLTVSTGDLRTLRMGQAADSVINVAGTVTSMNAEEFTGGEIRGGRYERITITGARNRGVAGNFSGSITPANGFSFLRVQGDFTGAISVRDTNTIDIAGNLRDSSIALTRGFNPTLTNIRTLTIGGIMERSEFRTSGIVGTIFTRAMIDSSIYVGVGVAFQGIPPTPSGTIEPAAIQSLTIAGMRGMQYGFVNSIVVAGTITRGTISQPQTDNFGRIFGVAAIRIQLLDTTIGRTVQRIVPNSTTPPAVGDYQVRVNFVAPA